MAGGRLAGVGQAYARVIASPSYFPLWLAQLLSSFGDALHYIALVVLVFQLTEQFLLVAGLFLYGLNTSTGMVVFNSTVQGAVPDTVRGRVFTLLDVTWSAMCLVSLALGGVLVDAVGIEPVFWLGGALLAAAGGLGLLLLSGYDLRARRWAVVQANTRTADRARYVLAGRDGNARVQRTHGLASVSSSRSIRSRIPLRTWR